MADARAGQVSAPGPGARSVHRGARLAAGAWAAGWLVAFGDVLLDPALWRAPWLVAGCAGLALVVALVITVASWRPPGPATPRLAASRHLPSGWLVAAVVAVSVLASTTARPATLHETLLPQMVLANLAVLVIALLLPPRAAVLPVLGVVAVELVGTWRLAVAAGLLEQTRTALRLAGPYALLDAVAVLVAVAALRAAAARADDAQALRTSVELHESARLFRAATVRRATRSIHDTALNTLSLVGAGRVVSYGETLRRSAAADVAALDGLATPADAAPPFPADAAPPFPADAAPPFPADAAPAAPPPATPRPAAPRPAGAVLAWWHQLADQGGLPLRIEGDPAALDRLPPPAGAAVQDAVAEAIRNAVRHSRAGGVSVSLAWSPPTLTVLVDDDGVGFDGPLRADGGVQRSIIDPCRACGVQAEVCSSRGAGTRVRLSWRGLPAAGPATQALPAAGPATQALPAAGLPTPGAPARPPDVFAAAMRPLAGGLWASLSALVLIMCAVTSPWGVGRAAWVAAGALTVVCGLAVWSARSSGRIGRAWTAALVALIPLAVLAPGSWLTGCTRVGQSWWGTDAALIPMLLVVLLRPGVRSLALVTVTYLASVGVVAAPLRAAGCLGDTLTAGAMDLIIAYVVVVLRQTVARLAADAERDLAAAGRRQVGALARDAQALQGRVVRARAVAAARAALAALADGAWDPRDPDIQHRCARVAGYLRTVLAVEDVSTPVGRWLLRLVDEAYDADVDLRLCVTPSTLGRDPATGAPIGPELRAWPWRAQAVIGSALLACVRAVPPGQTLTLTMLQFATDTRVTLLGPRSLMPVVRGRVGRLERQGFTVDVDAVDGQVLLSATHPIGGGASLPAPTEATEATEAAVPALAVV